jgi:hypothetical protein
MLCQDPGQERTVQMLQRLYDDLRAVHPAKRRPSGLTVVDNYDADSVKHGGSSGGGWCVVQLPVSCAAGYMFFNAVSEANADTLSITTLRLGALEPQV